MYKRDAGKSSDKGDLHVAVKQARLSSEIHRNPFVTWYVLILYNYQVP